MRKILIPLDGSEFSEAALTRGLALFPKERFHVVLLRAIDLNEVVVYGPGFPPQISIEKERHLQVERSQASYLSEKSAALEKGGHQVETVVVTGEPVDTILSVAETHQVELVVMTTHGRSGLKRLILGSVAEGVTRRAGLPVVLLPSGD